MSENKTKPTEASVDEFLAGVGNERKRADAETLIALMSRITGAPPRMWGPSIIGFGEFRYRYPTGREGDWPLVGFSPRKQSISLYLTCDIQQHADLLEKLGKHKTGKGCLYVDKLDDIHMPTLEKLVKRSMQESKKQAAAAAKK